MTKSLAFLALAAFSLGFAMPALAADSVLNFDDLTGFIPTTYGSAMTNTPNIGITYRSTGPIVRNFLNLSVSDYGDLVNVAQPVAEFDQGEIRFTPSNGVAVTLTSFDMAGWPQLDYTADVIQVVDANNTVLWSAPDLTVLGAGPTHSAFSVNVTSTIPIYLRFGNTYNIGIDNIQFSQSPVSAPEPGSLILLALGGATLGLARKKKRAVMPQ